MCPCCSPPARAWPTPFPRPGLRGRLQGLGKAKLPKLKWPPVPPGRLGDLTPLPSLSQWAVPRAPRPTREPSADTASGRALLVPPGPPGLESCAWPVSIYCLRMCRSLGPPACRLCPQARCHRPQQALPGPRQDNCGTKLVQLELSPAPPLLSLPRSGPGLEHTGACPCFSFSDREIKVPVRSQGVCLSSPGGRRGSWALCLCCPGAQGTPG